MGALCREGYEVIMSEVSEFKTSSMKIKTATESFQVEYDHYATDQVEYEN